MTSYGPATSTERYVGWGSSSFQWCVRVPGRAPSLMPRSRPFESTFQSSRTVASNSKEARSAGWSTEGYQWRAPSGNERVLMSWGLASVSSLKSSPRS